MGHFKYQFSGSYGTLKFHLKGGNEENVINMKVVLQYCSWDLKLAVEYNGSNSLDKIRDIDVKIWAQLIISRRPLSTIRTGFTHSPRFVAFYCRAASRKSPGPAPGREPQPGVIIVCTFRYIQKTRALRCWTTKELEERRGEEPINASPSFAKAPFSFIVAASVFTLHDGGAAAAATATSFAENRK